MRPLSIAAVLDCMDDVALLRVVDVPGVYIADTSSDDGVHVDPDYLVADAFPIVGRAAVVDYAYSALVDQEACSCFLVAYSNFVAAVDLDQKMACSVALEHCSVAAVAKNTEIGKFRRL